VSAAERILIVEGHEDLSMGALADGRDYLSSAHAIRAAEAESSRRTRTHNGVPPSLASCPTPSSSGSSRATESSVCCR
jgi:hypothetical protein